MKGTLIFAILWYEKNEKFMINILYIKIAMGWKMYILHCEIEKNMASKHASIN